MPIRSRGTYQVKRQRPRKRVTAESTSYEIPLVGPYDVLEAQQPAIGSTFSGYPSTFLVEDVSLEHTGGGSGRMVVTVTTRTPGTPTSPSTTQLAEPVYESDYAEEQLPIEHHKKCGKLRPNRFYYEFPDRAISGKNIARNKAELEDEDEAVCRQRSWDNWTVLDEDDYQPASGGWSLEEYKSLREAGIETYPFPFPICTMTTYHRSRPASGVAINTVSTPPSQCSPPPGFIYIKTVDRVTKQGRVFTRVQAWRGYVEGLMTSLLY